MANIVLRAAIAGLVLVVVVKSTPLDDYVNAPDAHYNFTVLTDRTVRVLGSYTVYTVNMTSQKWLTENDCNRPIWWHYLLVTVPDNIVHHDSGLVYITGGKNTDEPPDPLADVEALYVSLIGQGAGIVSACLFQIPNQPIVFKSDPKQKSRSEDAVIAFTWKHFLENGTHEPNWLLRFPMTKAVVRAMDTVTKFTSSIRPDLNISRYIVCGASKRGWTTWTVAAVDKRVIAMAPIVMDLLHLAKSLHHHYRSLGGWSFTFVDYWEENLMQLIDDPNYQKMADIIDPIVYKDRFAAIPKYIISTSCDEFFLPDDSHYFFDELTGKTYMRITQNAEHSLMGHRLDLMLNLQAFALAVLEGWTWPEISWTLSENKTHGMIEFHTNVKPEEIEAWMGTTQGDGRRDFRLLAAEKPGSSTPVPHLIIYLSYAVTTVSPGVYTAAFEKPQIGWRCFFIRATYIAPRNSPIYFTSEANIIPSGVWAAPDCYGKTCKGTLV